MGSSSDEDKEEEGEKEHHMKLKRGPSGRGAGTRERTLHSGGACGGGLAELKQSIWSHCHELMRQWRFPEHADDAPHKASAQEAGGSGKATGQETPRKLQLLGRTEMVHFLYVRGGWDLKECACCFDRAVSLGAERAVTMPSLDFVRSLLTKQPPDATPLVPCRDSILECALRVQAFGEQGELEPRAQFSCNADLQEGFGFFVQHVLSGRLEKGHAEGRGKGERREKTGEKAEGKRGGGGEKTGPMSAGLMGQMGRMWQPGQMGKVGEAMAALMAMLGGDDAGSMGMGVPPGIGGGGRSGKGGVGGGDLQGETWRENLKGREWERYVDGMAWILEHGGGEGREFRCSHCSEGGISSSSDGGGGGGGGRNSMNVAGRDIPKGMYVSGVGATDFAVAVASLFSMPEHRKLGGMFFAASQRASSSTGQDAAIEVARARLGQRMLTSGKLGKEGNEENEGGATGGRVEATASGAPAEGRPAPSVGMSGSSSMSSSSGMLSRGLMPVNTDPTIGLLTYRDAELMVEFAGLFQEAPACADCSTCITLHISHVPFVAVIANFAYRPVALLLDRFLSVYKPHSEVFQRLLARLGLESSSTVPHDSLSGKRSTTTTTTNSSSSSSSSVHALRERVEQVPVAFLLSLALFCAAPLLQQSGTEGGQISRAEGGTSGAKEKAGGRRAGSGDRGEGEKGSEGGDVGGDSGVVWEEVQSWFMVAMLPASGTGGGGVACGGKQAREEDAWPGGVNLVACLREMLLGEPCYRPASPAAPSSRRRGCSDVGCGKVEGGGVKLKNCSGCGKVAYCSRECQNAHWPSHKLTCPGRSSGKTSGKDESKDGSGSRGKAVGKVSGQGGEARWGGNVLL
ncbi:unnamed protein product [Closterium sp. Naga37s-1]|nr:unnamed protein product [Closterium sp. Naga37s-1]